MQKQIFGFGELSHLGSILKDYSIENIFLVVGKNSFRQEYLQKHLNPILKDYSYTHFEVSAANPSLEDISQGIAQFKSKRHSLCLAIGGGRILDSAKLINFFANQKISASDYFLDRPADFVAQETTALIALPSTAGTGSESTRFATLYIDNVKYSLDNPLVLPKISLIDPTIMENLPPIVTAQSGMDALTQAVESYWSVNSTEESRGYAKEAMLTIWPILKNSVLEPSLELRSQMSRGANLAGKAINLSYTTAAHAISYPMTANFAVEHGQAVGLSLPHFLEYNFAIDEESNQDSRGLGFVRSRLNEIVSYLDCASVQELKTRWIKLLSEIGLKSNLAQLGIQKENFQTILDQFNPDRARNNPRRVTKQNLAALLEKI